MNRNEELNNLVMFPSSKNFPPQGLSNEISVDFYLEEKRHVEEFGEFLNSDLFEINLDLEENNQKYSSFEEYMNRSQAFEALDLSTPPETPMKKLIEEQLQAIRKAKTQIRYYLDEIEMFLPKR